MFPFNCNRVFNRQARMQATPKRYVRRQLAAQPHVVEPAYAVPLTGWLQNWLFASSETNLPQNRRTFLNPPGGTYFAEMEHNIKMNFCACAIWRHKIAPYGLFEQY
jgi:hypothetical protein